MFRNWLMTNRNFILQNFPFLEDDFDALTDYEFFCKLIGYVMEFAKDNEDFNKRLTDLENYIKNLDLQEEVNNKLDEMAESGELAEIIAVYLELKSLLIFDTVSDMKSATYLADGSTVETLGFYSANDGGGAKYIIRELTGLDNIDEMFLIALTDVTLVAELIVVNNEVNVKQVGIHGIDSEDDTTKIKTACQKNYSVYFPRGTYLLSSQLVISDASHKIIRGDGMGKTIFKVTDSQSGAHTSYITTSADATVDIVTNDLTFKDFTINAGTQTTRRFVLSPFQVKGLTLENIEITGGCGYATRLNQDQEVYANNLYIHDISGYDGQVAGGFYGMNMKNVSVSNTRVINVGDHAFYLTGDGSEDWSYAENIELNNVYCENTGSDGYTAGGAITIYGNIKNVTVSNSIIKDSKQGIHISKHGDTEVTPKNVTITNCVIDNSYNDGIYCEGLDDEPVKDVTITNNIIDSTLNNEGIALRLCDSVVVNGNVIKNITRIGIELVNTDNAVINNNILKNNINHIWCGTRSSTHADNNVISNNTMYNDASFDAGNSGLYISAVSTNCISLNNNINNTGNYNYNVRGASNKSILQTMNNTQTNLSKKIIYASSIPSSNIDAEVGDICYNTSPSAGGAIGWVCTTAGTPGTWKEFGAIAE